MQKFFRLKLNLFFLVVSLLTIPALLTLIYFGVLISLGGIVLPESIFLLVIPVIYFGIVLFVLLKLFKAYLEKQSVFRSRGVIQRFLFFLYSLINIGIICFVLFGVYQIVNEPPPHLFPFDDSSANYTISKDDYGTYLISYKSTSDKNKKYYCIWDSSHKKTCEWRVDNDISGVAIGKSSVDLEPFLNKNLKLDGSFAFSDQQCIVNICKNFQRRLVVDIKKVEVK